MTGKDISENSALRAQLDQLQGQLATRRSIVHFARAAIATLLGVMVGGTSAAWLLEPERSGSASTIGMGITIGFALAAVMSLARGLRIRRRELLLYRDMQDIRQKLHLDDPSALLPR